MFPDGDIWIEQRPMVDSLDLELQNMMKEHNKKDKSEWADRARKLWTKGDVWWKDKMGVEHRMVIENTKRRKRWGSDKKGMGSHKTIGTGEVKP